MSTIMMQQEDFDRDVRNSMITKYVGLMGFTVLVWDHVISFSDEVEYIWKGTKGLGIYLFFLNRYLIPLSFIVNTTAYFRTDWTESSCSRFVRYEGAMTMIGLTVVALMMFLRIRALYARFLSVQALVLSILLIFVGVNSWLLTHGVPVKHPAFPYVDSCTMIIDPKVAGSVASASAWLPLLYDTVVVILTVARTASSVYSKFPGQMLRVLLREGIMYYCVIFCVALSLTIMILHADQSIRNISGQLHLCFTVAMLSRITLHLKRFAQRPIVHYDTALPPPFAQQRSLPSGTVVTISPPTFAASAGRRSQPRLAVLHGLRGDTRGASEDGSSFAMETFSTAATTGDIHTQHPQGPAEASASDNRTVP